MNAAIPAATRVAPAKMRRTVAGGRLLRQPRQFAGRHRLVRGKRQNATVLARLPGGFIPGERKYVLRQLAARKVGNGHTLEHVAQVRAHCDPHLLQRFG